MRIYAVSLIDSAVDMSTASKSGAEVHFLGPSCLGP